MKVSEVGFGGWAIGGNSYGKTDDAESRRALEAAFRGGVNFFDTADIYGEGHSEELIGEVFEGWRSEIVIASKAGWNFYEGGAHQDFRPEYIESACEKSLRRLRTDSIDVYQLHNPNLDLLKTKGEELFAPLKRLQKAGRIRFYGISIHVPQEGMEAIQLGCVDTLQVIYNLIDQRPAAELLGLAKSANVGLIAREPFACGMLTGKYGRNATFQGPDHRRRWRREQILRDLDKLDRVKAVLEPLKAPLPVLALEFVLAHEAVSTVIPGAKTVEQVRENIGASDSTHLSWEEVEKIRLMYQSDELFKTDFFRN